MESDYVTLCAPSGRQEWEGSFTMEVGSLILIFIKRVCY